MDSRGFTLIELLGVIIFISLITLLVLPNIVDSVRNSYDKVDDATLDLIYKASDLYLSNHESDYEKVNGNKYSISLKTLVDENILSAPINVSQNDITNSKCVQVVYDDEFKYELRNIGECEEYHP